MNIVTIGDAGIIPKKKFAAWVAAMKDKPGVKCVCEPGTREVFCDPDGTTAGLLLEIREKSAAEPPRYVRPGDVVRFEHPICGFYLANALYPFARLNGIAADPTVDAPAGFVRFLSSSTPGTFIPSLSRRTSQPMAARLETPAGVRLLTVANAGDGSAVPIMLGVGLRAFRIGIEPFDAGGASIAIPPDLAAVVRLHPAFNGWDEARAFSVLPWTSANPYIPGNNPAWYGLGSPAAGDLDLTLSATNRVADRDAPAGSIIIWAELLSAAGTGVAKIGIVAEGY